MIFVDSSLTTPVVVVCDDEAGPDYLVYTTKDRLTVVCEIHSVSGRLHFSTRENFCLSQGFISDISRKVSEAC